MARQKNPHQGAQHQQLYLPSKRDSHKGRNGGQDRPHPSIVRIEYVEMFSSVQIEGHYNGYDLIFDGRNLLKQRHGSRDKVEPTDSEAARFLQDLKIAMEHDKRIAGFLQRHIESAGKK